VRALRNRLAAAGGNLSPEQVQQIVRLHEPLESIVDNVVNQLGSQKASGKHKRPDDHERVRTVLEQINEADLFTFRPSRWFAGHAIFPRDILRCLPQKEYKAWIEGHIFELGCDQEAGRTLQPAEGSLFPASKVTNNQLRWYALRQILDDLPEEEREEAKRGEQKSLRGVKSRSKLLFPIVQKEPGLTADGILAYCATLPTNTLRFEAGQ